MPTETEFSDYRSLYDEYKYYEGELGRLAENANMSESVRHKYAAAIAETMASLMAQMHEFEKQHPNLNKHADRPAEQAP